MTAMNYINTLLEEKNIDLETPIHVEGPSGMNYMTLENVVDAIAGAPKHEQDSIRKTLVQIDFKNGDVMHFFRHLAGAIAA